MNFWTAAVIIAVIWGLVSAYRARHGIISDSEGNQSALPKGNEDELQREVVELRERLKVLERIATSDRTSKQIASEIESLRDK
ncbi:hypothetical protein [Altererythrobacter sp. ZODW24]|uniref:hypothetical protein n=1 Tax=Altererythrobacter sp. ZODW24 TaxID=2185142 RepID=UPI000DF7E004|nr:hypothetical protein [Altererythrobacter sp. ZODW24]